MPYVVACDGPLPTWVCWDHNTNLPRHTIKRPQPMSFYEARQLKQRADICCGGTLRIVRIAA